MGMLGTRIQAAFRAPDGLRRLFDFAFAKILYALPKHLREKIFSGRQHECPICGSYLNRFLTLHRSYHRWCPVCRSLQRHRLIWLMLQQDGFFAAKKPKRMLHIAPEEGLVEHFRAIEGIEYLSADLHNPNAMIKMDICNIQYPERSFDFILCSHVLEHVPDDLQALREFWRVLTDGGWALILVPILSETTFEDPGVTDPTERERLFGQLDHVRSYGPDVQERIEQAGFRVRSLKTHDIITSTVELNRFGLEENETLFICKKTSV